MYVLLLFLFFSSMINQANAENYRSYIVNQIKQRYNLRASPPPSDEPTVTGTLGDQAQQVLASLNDWVDIIDPTSDNQEQYQPQYQQPQQTQNTQQPRSW